MDKTSITPVRRLLPYEVVLCRELGISRDEYLEFLAEQKRSSQITFGGPTMIAVEAIISIVLAVFGLIFQVVALLLRPQPPKPEGARREERFSPTFGFNSVQELAKYGDPVNLIYTSRTQNPAGGVRVNTSLVWSNVLSFGSSQFYQALTVLGAGEIVSIDATKSGFGQSLISQQPSSRTWQYYRSGATTGLNLPVSSDRINANTATDPGLGSTYVYEVRDGATNVEGFSQAFSPTAANALGVYAPIPINMVVRVDNPNDKGGVDRQEAANGITSSVSWAASQAVTVGATLDITIAATPLATAQEYQNSGNDAGLSAFENRTAAAQGLNSGVIYRLGSSEWEFVDYQSQYIDPIDGNVVARFRCTKAGTYPSTAYGTQRLDGFNLSSASVTMPGNVSTANNTLYSVIISIGDFIGAFQSWPIGTKVHVSTPGTYPSPLAGSTDYYVIPVDASTIRLATTYQNAIDGVAIDLTTAGLGTLTVTPINVSTGWEHTKCLVRQERAEYKTLTNCDIVDFAMRGKVYRRINGRSKPSFSAGQNGYKARQSFFRLEYKARSESTYTVVPGYFVVRRSADNDSFFYLKFRAGSRGLWDFRFVPVYDLPAEGATSDTPLYYLNNGGTQASVTTGSHTLYYQGVQRTFSAIPNDSPPVSREWDLFSLDSFTSYSLSSDSGPELSLNVVNEQQVEDDYTLHPSLYNRLSLLGINLYSGRNIQDVRQISAFVDEGRKVRRISTTTNTWPEEPDGASCYAPDIFLDTLLDSLDGVGSLVPEEAVNADSLVLAKKFCERNNLFFDCVIADNSNWRSFWAEKAPYSLLEFTRINGKEGLIPAVPVDSEGNITRTLNLAGFFNESNILEGSYREEYLDYGDNTKDLEATVIYRTLDEKAFPVQMSVIVQRSDATNPTRQSFDLSGYVTTKAQAVLFAKLLCNIRRYQQRGVEFKTYGTAVGPGDYIRVETTLQQWETVYTGRISEGQPVGLVAIPDGVYTMLLFKSGNPSVSLPITVRNGYAYYLIEENLTTSSGSEVTTDQGSRIRLSLAQDLTVYNGWLFVLGNPITHQRIFRIAETNTDEDGVITIKATEYPVDSDNRALISDFRDSLFTVTG